MKLLNPRYEWFWYFRYIIYCPFLIKQVIGDVHIYIRTKSLFNAFFVATDEDREDPDYTDPCVEAVNTICTYCCILSKEECSRDIRACDPIPVEDRQYYQFYIFIGFILSVLCGLPLFAMILKAMLMTRCCIVITFPKLCDIEKIQIFLGCHLYRNDR